MKRILLVTAYDGTDFAGFQAQKSMVRTVEGVLNQALHDLTGEDIEVIGASRTDAGVHAYCNMAVFDTGSRIPAEKFARALNVRLPEDVRVRESFEVPADFHPRHCSTIKTYAYRILNADVPLPEYARFCHFSYTPYDLDRMREAAEHLVGEHDFKSFASVAAQAKTTVREITALSVTEERLSCPGRIGRFFEEDRDRDKDPSPTDTIRARMPRIITIRVSGTGFLYNMVRIIAGTLMEAGRGHLDPGRIPEILEEKDRQAAGPTAPACGLTLVDYQILDMGGKRPDFLEIPG